jgi:hypothetical protein
VWMASESGMGIGRISDDQIALLQWHQDPGAAATYPTGDSPFGVAFDGTNIWITNNSAGTVSKPAPVIWSVPIGVPSGF